MQVLKKDLIVLQGHLTKIHFCQQHLSIPVAPHPCNIQCCQSSSRQPLQQVWSGVLYSACFWTDGLQSSLTVINLPGIQQPLLIDRGLLKGLNGKEATCQCRRHGFSPWVGKIPWRRKWQPTAVFFPGKSHGQRSLAGSIQSVGSQNVKHDLATDTPPPLYFFFCLSVSCCV